MEKLASVVAKKLHEPASALVRPIISNWRFYEKTQPPLTSATDEITNPPLPYDHNVVKTDLNDQKDTEKVLRQVPKKYWAQALRLLESFELRSDELTYDCSGVIYIDQESIPNSCIFDYMPYLFKKRIRKDMPGFLDFVNKIVAMGLEHLIVYHPKQIKLISKKAPESSSTTTANWWYLGPS